MKYIRPEFYEGQTVHFWPLNKPIAVRLLKADASDSPAPFESVEPVTVEIFRSQKQAQPTYTLPLQNAKVSSEAGSLTYEVGDFTITRVGTETRNYLLPCSHCVAIYLALFIFFILFVQFLCNPPHASPGPNEEEIKGAETVFIGFSCGGLLTRPTARSAYPQRPASYDFTYCCDSLQLTLCSGPVASIHFDPTEPVPLVMRYKETLPACKITLLDREGEPVCRPPKKGPTVRTTDLL